MGVSSDDRYNDGVQGREDWEKDNAEAWQDALSGTNDTDHQETDKDEDSD